MDLLALSVIGLITLVIVSRITSLIFNIMADLFYSYFHFAAGVLSAFFFYSLTGIFLLAIILTVLLGIVWEIFEWYEWKLVLKKKKHKPKPQDTKNDLVVDFMGSLTGVTILALGIVK